jgi:hypothetical protein
MNKKIIHQVCLSILLSLTFLCSASRTVFANEQSRSVTILMENVEMEKVMAEIEKQTRYLFGINDNVDVKRYVTVNVTARPLTEALDQMVGGLPANRADA